VALGLQGETGSWFVEGLSSSANEVGKLGWQHRLKVNLKRRKITRMGFNAELDVQEFLENCGYAVSRDRLREGYDLLATKGGEALYVQVKTLTNNRGEVRLNYKELEIMLREAEFGDGRGFSKERVPCFAVVMRKYIGRGRRSKRLVLFFKGRAYSKRARHLDLDYAL